jgi:hypothetical protein
MSVETTEETRSMSEVFTNILTGKSDPKGQFSVQFGGPGYWSGRAFSTLESANAGFEEEVALARDLPGSEVEEKTPGTGILREAVISFRLKSGKLSKRRWLVRMSEL